MKRNNQLKAKKPLKPKLAGRPKPKKPSVAKLKAEADKWFSKATRYRFAEFKNGEWVARCITCQAEKPVKQLQCGHFMSRQHNFLRYSEENTAPQCYGCNVMQQGRQFTFGIEIDKLYGDGTAKRLHQESKQLHPLTIPELQEIINDAKAVCVFYESRG